MMDKLAILILIFFMSACSYSKRTMDDTKDNNISTKASNSFDYNHPTLTLLIHSGVVFMEIHDADTTVISEAQIISCTPITLTYGYGSVIVDSDTLKDDIEWFNNYAEIKDYSIRKRELDAKEKKFVSMAITELLNSAYYESPIIVKDDWEYILYVNNIKVASGYVSTLNTFPKTIYYVIEQLLAMAAPLYSRNSLT